MNRLQATLLLAAMLGSHNAFALELLRSNPATSSELAEPVKVLQLWFDQAPKARERSVRIVSVGDNSANDQYRVAGLHSMDDNSLMAMVTDAMPDGDYELQWQVGASKGVVPFSVKRPKEHVDDVWEPPLDIGIVLYDGAEPLDVFGPLEMWMNAGPQNIRVHLIAQEKGPVVLTTTSYPKELAPRLQAQYSFANVPELDVLMVPGGIGTLVEVDNPDMIRFLQQAAAEVAVATSVCTGSALYAKAGLLKGVKATGNKAFFDYLVSQGPADWQPEARWVESGRYLTSSGVSAGIDMSLAVIARFFGIESARMIAASTEYVWNEDASNDPFVQYANSAVPHVDALRKRFVDD